MKKTITALLLTGLACSAQALPQTPAPPTPEPMCEVRVCNKLERFTLSITSMVKDHIGETCFDTRMPKSEAVVDKVLDSSSKWYQGSFNPTKKSVTRIKSVGACH